MNTNWNLISSENLTDTIDEICSQNYITDKWYRTKIPSTVLAALVENGVYENIYFGTNLKKIQRNSLINHGGTEKYLNYPKKKHETQFYLKLME